MIEVYPCYTLVVTKLSKINGMVTAITIRNSAVAYEIKFFSHDDFKTEWMNENEFTVTDGKKETIGFK